MSIFIIGGRYMAMCRTAGGGGVVASGRSYMDAISAALIKKEAVEVARDRVERIKVSVACACTS